MRPLGDAVLIREGVSRLCERGVRHEPSTGPCLTDIELAGVIADD